MRTISQIYRKACREIELAPADKALFMKLLREISVNALRSRKNWNKKEDFMALFFISVGRFPGLEKSSKIIGDWAAKYLPFELNEEERDALWK